MKSLFIVIENGENYVTTHGIRTSEKEGQALLKEIYDACIEAERKESAFPIAEEKCRLNPEQRVGVVKHIMTDGSIGGIIKFYLLKIDVNEKHALRLSKYLMSHVAEP